MTDLSYQLYSSREFPPLDDTLKMLAGLGYKQVEGFGGVYGNLQALQNALQSSGLSMTTGHFGIDQLDSEPDAVIELARNAGMKAIYCPYLDAQHRPSDAAGWRAFGERVQKAGEPIIAAGFTYGWHNHDFEFVAGSDGAIPMEEIFKGGPELSWEADIAWIVRGGGDPIDWIKKHGHRISSVHIKDIAPKGECTDEDGWADVGHGTMDWKAIWQALQDTPAQYFIMEHDKPNDHERFARRSIEFVNGL